MLSGLQTQKFTCFTNLNSRIIISIDLCYPDKIIFISSRNVLIEKNEQK